MTDRQTDRQTDRHYTDETRNALRDKWVRNTDKYLKSPSLFEQALGILNIKQMFKNISSGSGTNAEALSRLQGIGHDVSIDHVKEILDKDGYDTSDEELLKKLGLK